MNELYVEKSDKFQDTEYRLRNVSVDAKVQGETKHYEYDTCIIFGTNQNGQIEGFADITHSGVPHGRCEFVGSLLAIAEKMLIEMNEAERQTALIVKGELLKEMLLPEEDE